MFVRHRSSRIKAGRPFPLMTYLAYSLVFIGCLSGIVYFGSGCTPGAISTGGPEPSLDDRFFGCYRAIERYGEADVLFILSLNRAERPEDGVNLIAGVLAFGDSGEDCWPVEGEILAERSARIELVLSEGYVRYQASLAEDGSGIAVHLEIDRPHSSLPGEFHFSKLGDCPDLCGEY